MKLSMLAIPVAVLSGCASTPLQPPAMTAEEHDRFAEREEERASNQLQKAEEACPGYESQDACRRYWTSFPNPTKKHFDKAQKHHGLSEQHRQAGRQLREAEARLCAGIPDEQRNACGLLRPDKVVKAETLAVDVRGNVLTGARVVVRAVPAGQADAIQRVIDCTLAHQAIAARDRDPELSFCPLAVRGVTALAHPVAEGVAIEIRPGSPGRSEEVRLRTDALVKSVASRPAQVP